jgi:hypothetical protein
VVYVGIQAVGDKGSITAGKDKFAFTVNSRSSGDQYTPEWERYQERDPYKLNRAKSRVL